MGKSMNRDDFKRSRQKTIHLSRKQKTLEQLHPPSELEAAPKPRYAPRKPYRSHNDWRDDD